MPVPEPENICIGQNPQKTNLLLYQRTRKFKLLGSNLKNNLFNEIFHLSPNQTKQNRTLQGLPDQISEGNLLILSLLSNHLGSFSIVQELSLFCLNVNLME